MLAQYRSMCNRGWSDDVNYPHGCYVCGVVVITKKSGDHEISITNSKFHENFEPQKFGVIRYFGPKQTVRPHPPLKLVSFSNQ